ncbi:hypothetical protein SAMN02982918_2350 [Saccharomonospora viridis]|nr:hypothetical protein SAMN02982918_2350 [Saccharomonospora viridis]
MVSAISAVSTVSVLSVVVGVAEVSEGSGVVDVVLFVLVDGGTEDVGLGVGDADVVSRAIAAGSASPSWTRPLVA